MLWTPGYWGWGGGAYIWHAGYSYNTAVTNVNTTVIHNTYNKTVVVNNTTVNNVSYNGGKGGTTSTPTAEERSAEKEQHTPATKEQTEHEDSASTNKALLASENHGKPSIAATPKAGQFKGSGVVGAGSATSRNASFHPPKSGEHTEAAKTGNKTVASNKTATSNSPHENSGGGSNTNAKHNESKPQPKNKNNNAEHHEGKERPR
jgi:hypothetical protein